MKWFRRHKEEPEYGIFTSQVPMTTMTRWFVYDIGYNDSGIEDILGLSPVSDEGSDKELEDSEDRLDAIGPLIPFMSAMADISSTVLSVIAMELLDESELADDESIEEIATTLKGLYKSVALSSIIGSLSIATSLGLIDVAAISGELKDVDINGGFNE